MNQPLTCPSCQGETTRLVTCPLCGEEVCLEVCAPTPADLLFYGLTEFGDPTSSHERKVVAEALATQVKVVAA